MTPRVSVLDPTDNELGSEGVRASLTQTHTLGFSGGNRTTYRGRGSPNAALGYCLPPGPAWCQVGVSQSLRTAPPIAPAATGRPLDSHPCLHPGAHFPSPLKLRT